MKIVPFRGEFFVVSLSAPAEFARACAVVRSAFGVASDAGGGQAEGQGEWSRRRKRSGKKRSADAAYFWPKSGCKCNRDASASAMDVSLGLTDGSLPPFRRIRYARSCLIYSFRLLLNALLHFLIPQFRKRVLSLSIFLG